MQERLYTFELASPVDGATHIAVLEETRNGDRIIITGEYGVGADPFEPAAMMIAYTANITGEELVDLDEESKAAGRPASKGRHEMDSADVAAWLGEDPATKQARIEARRPAPEPEEGGPE